MSLKEFMVDNNLSARPTGGVPCNVCMLQHELRLELIDARARIAPVSFSVLARYVQSLGHKITYGQLAAHFRKGHER